MRLMEQLRREALRPNDRRNAILTLSGKGEELVVDEIADRFGVSRETIRRDLARLDTDGLIRRVHGGAVPPRIFSEAPFHDRQRLNADAKRRIANCAKELFGAGDSLFIDTGSTTEAFARELASVGGLTVVTNSTRVAAPISAGSEKSSVYVLGGQFQAETGQMLGSLCIEQLDRFHAEHAVLGVGAISADGRIMDYDMDEAALARAMIGHVRHVTLLADHSKFDQKALVTVCKMSAVQRIVTDKSPPKSILQALRAACVEIVVAEK